MNKTYRRNEHQRRDILIRGAVIGVVLVVVWALGSSLPILSSLASRLSTPLWSVGDHASLVASLGVRGLSSGSALVAENDALKREVESLKNEDSALTAQANSYTELLNRFGRSLDEGGVLAGVLSTPPRSLYDTIVIDAGSQANVIVGMIAYTDAGTPIGEVARISSIASVVELFSSPGKSLEVVVGEEHVRATAEGQGGTNMVIRLPRDIPIAVGDAITLPTLVGAVLGHVAVINVQPTDSFQTIRFSLHVSLQRLRVVMLRNYAWSVPEDFTKGQVIEEIIPPAEE